MKMIQNQVCGKRMGNGQTGVDVDVYIVVQDTIIRSPQRFFLNGLDNT